MLITEFLKGVFVAGLRGDNVRYIVNSKVEQDSLAQLIESAIQEESEIKSQAI